MSPRQMAEPQSVGRNGTGNNGVPQAQSQQKSTPTMPQKINGTDGAPKGSWAKIAGSAPANGAAPQEKPAAPPAAAPQPAATGVKLPAGVTPAPAAQGSIKFGSIDPAELQQQQPQQIPARPKLPPINTVAAPAPAPPAPLPPQKPVSFAAATSGVKQGPPPPQPPPPQQQRGGPPGGPRAPRAPQHPVPAVARPGQGGGFGAQTMPAAYMFAPGAIMTYPQAYIPSYNTAVPAQQAYYGQPGGYGQGGYPGFNYGTHAPTGNIPQGSRGPQGPQVPTMPVPPPPPQVTGSGAAAAYGGGGAAPTPVPVKPAAPAARRILRIENPDTHEVLNLAQIAASQKPETPKKDTKAAVDEQEEAPGKALKDAAIATERKTPTPAAISAGVAAAAAAIATTAAVVQPADEKKMEPQPVEESKAVEEPAVAVVEKPAEEAVVAVEPVKEAKHEEAEEDEEPPSAAESEQTGAHASELSPSGSKELGQLLSDNGKVRYTTEFMLTIRPFCRDLPPHIEPATLSALADDGSQSRGPPGGPPDSREWKSAGGPRGVMGPPGGMMGPPGSGMRGGRGGGRRMMIPPGGIDGDIWERGKALPPMPGNQFAGRGPPPGMRMPTGPLPALHKTDSAYKIGKVITEDPEEERAQKALKALLNKITPENFEKIIEQIVAKFNERKKAQTLYGFIDQIFDKALIETTFSELYANLVSELNRRLPPLEEEDGTSAQFRRTLLNKCQIEFEHGVLAMKAVAEREKREHDNPKAEESNEEVEEEPAAEVKDETAPETEEGEITDEKQLEKENAEQAKREDRATAAAEVQARKRMLGNIIFVGQLYRFGVLTEQVMHTCIQTLLEETQNPRAEDVECLCKLLTTIGRSMDNSGRTFKKTDEEGNKTEVPTNDMMKLYFKRIDDLAKNEALDSRHRFMLHDLIDLRRNKWILRRQAEGPKKIDEIHREAALERTRAQMLDRQQSRGGRDQPRGGPRPGPDHRLDTPVRMMNRASSQDAVVPQSLRPGGRPAPPPRPPTGAPPPEEDSEVVEDTPVADDSAGPSLTEDQIASKVKGLLAEMFTTKDVAEATTCVKELVDGQADMSIVVDTFFMVSFEGKNTSWDTLQDLFKKCSEEKLISSADFEQGSREVLNKLVDTAVDNLNAPSQLGGVLAYCVANGIVDLKVIAQHILDADIEDPEDDEFNLVASGIALKVFGFLLQGLKNADGAEKTAADWKATAIDYHCYIPAEKRESAEVVEKFLAEFNLSDVL